MPSHFVIKYLRKYGASIGDSCMIEKGLNIHRPETEKPFKNLVVGNDVYIGHKVKIDLSRKVTLHDNVIIGSRSMLWTHASYYFYENFAPICKEHYGEVELFEYALIYSGVIISYGIKIGKRAIVGAGSMVNRPVEDKCFYGGVPARFIKKIE
jgi:maltose O-acetyltransferase